MLANESSPPLTPASPPPPAAELAVADSLSSSLFNGYAPTAGLPQARKAIADCLSWDLSYMLAADYLFVTSGCTQAIDNALWMLSRPDANILLGCSPGLVS